MATWHGKGGMVYLQGSGSTATKLGDAREWTIDIDRELDEDNALGDTWRTQLSGMLSWTGSVEGNCDNAETSPFDAATATSTRALYLYYLAGTVARYYYGSVWPKLSVTSGVSGTARYSLDFDGDGQLATQ